MFIDYDDLNITDNLSLYSTSGNTLTISSGNITSSDIPYSGFARYTLPSNYLFDESQCTFDFDFCVNNTSYLYESQTVRLVQASTSPNSSTWDIIYQTPGYNCVREVWPYGAESPEFHYGHYFMIPMSYYDDDLHSYISCYAALSINLQDDQTYYCRFIQQYSTEYPFSFFIYDNVARTGTPLSYAYTEYNKNFFDGSVIPFIYVGNYDTPVHRILNSTIEINNINITRNNISGNINSYIRGSLYWESDPKTSDCFVNGYDIDSKDISLSIVSYIYEDKTQNLILWNNQSGYYADLSIHGSIGDFSNSINMSIVGNVQNISGVDLYLRNTYNTDNITAYIEGETPDNITVYMSDYRIQVLGDTYAEYLHLSQLPINVLGDVASDNTYNKYIHVSQVPVQVLGDTASGEIGNQYIKLTQLPIQIFCDFSRPQTSSTDTFIHGHEPYNSGINLYTAGCLGDNTITSDLFMYGNDKPDNFIDLYTYGHDIINDYQELYTKGAYYASLDNQTLFVHGYEIYSNSINMSIVGCELSYQTVDEFIYGYDIHTNTNDLYTQGPISLSIYANCYILGFENSTNNITEFIHGYIVQTDSIDLYTQGSEIGDCNLALYINAEPDNYNKYITCYLCNYGISDTINLYIAGDGINDGALVDENTLNLFIGKNNEVGASMDLFTVAPLGSVNTFIDINICGGLLDFNSIDLIIPNIDMEKTKTIKMYTSGY